jgi:hypothetical protein
MGPLVGGQWAEARTLAIGAIAPDPRAGGAGGGAHVTDLSYFSRLADHATFIRRAHVEVHRRGAETAGVVVGVMDGADWLQKLLDRSRPDAVRVLDFPHALEHVTAAAAATFGAGAAAGGAWIAAQADALKHGAPSAVLAALLALPSAAAADPSAAAAARDAAFGYLVRRLDQIRYAEFLERGYPIGSGLAESANKLVVEVRLKGSGMHWARANVNPMLALRNITCNERWGEAWPLICARLRAREQARRPVPTARPPAPPPPPPAPRPRRPPRIVNGRPTADHPWRRPFLRPGIDKVAS